MKKLLVLFGILIVAPISANAYVYESETSAINTLKAQGYSESTLQIVDWVNYRNRNKNGRYVRNYQPSQNKLGRAYSKAKAYLDPIQDDGSFGDHHIEFSNTWMGDDTFYSSELKSSGQSENL